MDHPDTATVYLTENGGRKWDLFIELPGYGKAFNTVRINDDVYCAIQHHSAYEIEMITHEGSNWWSDYKFAKLPILLRTMTAFVSLQTEYFIGRTGASRKLTRLDAIRYNLRTRDLP